MSHHQQGRTRASWRRVAAIATALAITAGACGGDDDDASSDSTAVTTTPSTAAATQPPSTPASTSTSAAASGTRSVDTPLGHVEVPADPQRIVVLWGATLSSLVQLGFDPVASFANNGDPASLLPYLPDDYPVEQLTFVAERRAVNFEAVAAVQPDLILGGTAPHLEEAYAQLSAIAPTVLLEWDGTRSWRTMLTDVADVLGVPDRADAAVAEYDAHVAEVRAALHLDETPLTVSLARIQASDEIRIETPESFSGQILADVGFQRPANQITPDADADYISLSLERIPDLDAEWLIAAYYVNDGESAGAYHDVTNQPLWQTLPAVQAGRVIDVDFDYWSSSNYYAAHRVLDDLQAAFAS